MDKDTHPTQKALGHRDEVLGWLDAAFTEAVLFGYIHADKTDSYASANSAAYQMGRDAGYEQAKDDMAKQLRENADA